MKKKAPGHGWYKFWLHFKTFIIPIILYQFPKDPFCLIILYMYDILFYFIHVYKAPGQEETTLGDQGMVGTSSGSILKLLLFPSFCTSSQKIPFFSLFYTCMIFCFISYMYMKPQGKKRQPLGTFCFKETERSYHFDHGCMLKKEALPSDFMHIYHDLYMPLGRGRQPIRAKIFMSTGRPHHYDHLLQF